MLHVSIHLRSRFYFLENAGSDMRVLIGCSEVSLELGLPVAVSLDANLAKNFIFSPFY